MPKGYFGTAGEILATEFRKGLVAESFSDRLADSSEELMEGFPEAALVKTLQRSWHPTSTTIYSNWLRYIVSQKADISKLLAVTAVQERNQRKPMTLP